MKKRDLAKLALLGISAGLIATGCQQGGGKSGNKGAAAEEQMTSDMQTFYSSLSPSAQKKFMELDAQHRMMAMEMVKGSCNGKNNCKGMGGCATQSHACAGQNGCKGQGGAPIKDANKAVEVQYKNQTKQRQNMNGSMQSQQGQQQYQYSQGQNYQGQGYQGQGYQHGQNYQQGQSWQNQNQPYSRGY